MTKRPPYEDKLHVDMPLGEALERLVGVDPKEMIDLSISTGVRHIIQKSNVEFEKELDLSVLMIQNLDQFLENPLEEFPQRT